jgi:hypothetical protein
MLNLTDCAKCTTGRGAARFSAHCKKGFAKVAVYNETTHLVDTMIKEAGSYCW